MEQFAIRITSPLGFYPSFNFSILLHYARGSKCGYLQPHLFCILRIFLSVANNEVSEELSLHILTCAESSQMA